MSLVWAHAWMTKGDLTIDKVGIAYMLGGDSGASNSDCQEAVGLDRWDY